MLDEDILDNFRARIRKLHEAAKSPSVRVIAAGTRCSKTGINDLIKGRKIPGFAITLKIIEFLGGDQEEWAPLVNEARAAQARSRSAGRLRDGSRLPAYRLKGVMVIAVMAIIVAVIQQAVRMLMPVDSPYPTPIASSLPVVGMLHCAVTTKDQAPVYRTPDLMGAILKKKERQASVTYDDKYQDVTKQGEIFRAVRTPRDSPGYHWMLLKHLREAECGP